MDIAQNQAEVPLRQSSLAVQQMCLHRHNAARAVPLKRQKGSVRGPPRLPVGQGWPVPAARGHESLTLSGSELVMTHTHCALSSYWTG